MSLKALENINLRINKIIKGLTRLTNSIIEKTSDTQFTVGGVPILAIKIIIHIKLSFGK